MSIFSIRTPEDLIEYLTPPVFPDDPDKTHAAQILNTILLGLSGVLTAYLILEVLFGSQQLAPLTQLIYLGVVVLMLGLVGVMRRGYVTAATVVWMVATWLIMAYIAWNGSGIQGPGFITNIIIIIAASVLLGWQASLIVTVLTIALGWFYVYAFNNGLISYDIAAPSSYAIGYTGLFAAVALLQYILVSTLSNALKEARQSNATLRTISDSLEQRVADRTRDLNIAAEIGRTLSQVYNVDELMSSAVNLIRERFDLYYVHIALIDESGRWLRLQSGTGEIGEKLKERSITFAINEKSLNGMAAYRRATVVQSDATTSLQFMPHELLPHTKSEIAVPLFRGDEVIGVLDFQSDQVNGLTQDNVPALETLAAQLVTAMNNARLFNEQGKLTQTLNSERSTLQTVLESMPAGIIVLAAGTGRVLLSNQRATDMLGDYFTAEDETIPAELLNQFYHFDSKEPYDAQELPLFKALAGEVSAVDDLEVRHSEAEQHMVLEVTGTPIYDPDGRLISAMSIFQDISARKQSETLLNVRIKELDLLSNIGRQMGSNRPIPEFLAAVAQQIPAGMQHSDICQVAITLDGVVYGDPAAIELPYQMVQGIRLQDELVGHIYIAYEEKYDFLDEESALIGDVGRRVSSYVETQRLIAEIASRANELQTMSEVSTAVASTLDEQKLLQDVVDLTKERFNLYHAHIYLLDSVTNELVLTAGAGEVGQKMVREGRRIPLNAGRSIVASTARNRNGSIVNDVHSDPNFLPHPLLPDTQSELAVPLIAGDTVLGVLDIQSNQIDHFSPDSLQVQMTLAAQIAIALQNAIQYQQTEETLEELRHLQSFVTRQGWETFMLNPNRPLQGFTATPTDIQPILRSAKPARQLAGVSDHVAQLNVRGTTVGGLSVRTREDRPLSPEDKELLSTISDQVAEALERARLFEETELSRSRTDMLYQFGRVLLTAENLLNLLQIIANTAAQAVHADRTLLILFDVAAQKITHTTAGGPNQAQVGLDFSFADIQAGLSGWVVTHKEAALSPKNKPDEREEEAIQAHRQQAGVGAVLVVPLIYQERVLGTLTAINTLDQPDFTQADLDLLNALAAQAAVAIENQLLFGQTQARAQREHLLREVTNRVNAAIDAESVLRVAATEIGQALGLQTFVYLTPPTDNEN